MFDGASRNDNDKMQQKGVNKVNSWFSGELAVILKLTCGWTEEQSY